MKKYIVISKEKKQGADVDYYDMIRCSFDTLQEAFDFITIILSSSTCSCEIYQEEDN